MVEPMSGGLAYMFWFFVLCDFGEKVTNRFVSLSDSIYDVWYLYPVDQQKYFSLMILNAEQPVHIEGFIIQSTRETFKKVKSKQNSVINSTITLYNLFYFQGYQYDVLILFDSSPIYLEFVSRCLLLQYRILQLFICTLHVL